MTSNELWFYVLILGTMVVPICGYGIGQGIIWLLQHRAARIDARRRHQLALERERTRQIEAQRARDEALWLRALEDQDK